MSPRCGLASAAGLVLLACAHVGHEGGAGKPALEEARDALTHGTPDKAYALLQQLHSQRPDDLEVGRALAEAAIRSGRAAELAATLQAANARAETAANHYMLGLLRFDQAKDARGAAREELERAIRLSPKTAELYYRLGVALLKSEQYEESVPPLKRAQELDPGRESIELRLAEALARTGDRPGAVAALRRLVSGHPGPAELAEARALMQDLEDPFARFPQAAKPRLDIGLHWVREVDNPQQAIIVFEDILNDFPDLAVVHALLGLAYEKLDDPARAVDEFKKAAELEPDAGKNYLYLGQVYFARGRLDPAREAFEKAVERNPLLDEAYLKLADMALDRRDLPRAERYYGILTALQPEDFSLRSKLATALQLDGDLSGAERTLREGLTRSPHNVDLLLRLGLVYLDERARASNPAERQRTAAEAGRCLREVLDAQPQNALASRALQALK